jgi:hypothetical protein
MRLIEDLERRLAGEQSMFQAQLLREDIGRLKKLEALAAGAADEDAFVKAGLRIGWTPGDARTAELREALEPFLRAVHSKDEGRVELGWNALHRLRMERLLGCLSTPVPKPAD